MTNNPALFNIALMLLLLPGERTIGQWTCHMLSHNRGPLGKPHTQSAGMEPESRPGVSIGMGVAYVNPQDVVDYIRGIVGRGQDLPEFKSSVEFFGAVSFPLSAGWNAKLEYAYLLGTYNATSLFGPADFSFSAHMPSLIGQYVLVDEGLYNIKVGAGGGYHFGALSESFGARNTKLTGQGVGAVIDLEANTAFGESFFGYFGGNFRWEFIGDLTTSARVASAGSIPTLHFFGLGARFGFTHYF